VAASLQAPTLFTIAEDLRQMQVHAAVSEADVGKLAAGMRASFAVDAYPQDRFEGTIRQIRDAPQNVQNVVTYDAVIQVDNTAMKLKPGMTANVTFIYADRQNVLRVPTAALRFRPPAELVGGATKVKGKAKNKDKDKGKEKDKDSGKAASAAAAGGSPVGGLAPRSVWALRGGALVEIPVTVGVADGSNVEVSAPDLAEGDVVVTDAVGRAEHSEAKRMKAQAGAATKGFF
jgi:HlyD family secretion protein